MNPPITPKGQSSSRWPSESSFVSIPGMIVWYGRLDGARQFGCDASSTKLWPRFCSVKPQPAAPMPVPKPDLLQDQQQR